MTAYLWNKSSPNNPPWTHNHFPLGLHGQILQEGSALAALFPLAIEAHNSPPRLLNPTVTNPTGISPTSFLLPQGPCPPPGHLGPVPHTSQTPSKLTAHPLYPWSSHYSLSSQTLSRPDALSPCLLSACPTLPSCPMMFNKGPEGDVRGDQGRLCEEKPMAWQGPCA